LVTLAGFATSVMYNSAFRITPSFQSESIFSWPLWGIRSLVAPVFYVGRAFVTVLLLFSLWRLCLLVPPLRSWWKVRAASRQAFTERLRSLPTLALAQVLLIVHCAVIALNFWYFSGFMQGFDALIVRTTTGSLAQLGPAHHADHLFYREVLSLELGVFAVAWLTLFVLRRKRSESWIDVGIVGSLLVVFTLFLLALPYRVIFHNDHERVFYGSDTCYLMSQSGNEGLLFCPMRNSPRSQIVRLDDVRLVRGGTEEDVFSRVGQGR
jgi:hypothetical protein